MLKQMGLRALDKLVRTRGYAINRADELLDLPADTRGIVERVRPFTMTGPERISNLCNAVEYVVRNDIPGDFVECGVWRGGSSMAAALSFLALGRPDRSLWLYDTFEGMPEPTELDREIASGTPAGQMLAESDRPDGVRAFSPFGEAEANLRSTGYPMDRIAFVKGKVEETIPQAVPERICILRLDTDWYESTRHELVHLFPRLSVGGVLIIDDYGHWAGARQAVDEYIAENRIRILLSRIDYTGRIGVKTA